MTLGSSTTDSGTEGAAPDAAPSSPDAVEEDARFDAPAEVAPESAVPPPQCSSTTFLPEDVIAKATVVTNSICMHCSDDGFWRTQQYMRGKVAENPYPGGDAFVSCLAAVTNGCEGVRACWGLSPLAPGDTCDTCVGTTAVFCISDLKARWDCARWGGTCTNGKCAYPDSPICDYFNFTPSCNSEGQPTYCYDRIRTGPACPNYGLVCQPPGWATDLSCAGTGAACESGHTYFDISVHGTACQGDLLNTCQGDRTALLRCPCFGDGHTCQSVGSTSFCGVANECDPETFEKLCKVNSVVFCNAGKITTVDCVKLGFSRCVSDRKYGCQSPCGLAGECAHGQCIQGYCM
jgi:hypothetical protein